MREIAVLIEKTGPRRDAYQGPHSVYESHDEDGEDDGEEVPVERVGEVLLRIAQRGISILLVEQKLSIALRISQRVYVMGQGRIVFAGSAAEFASDSNVAKQWLEV